MYDIKLERDEACRFNFFFKIMEKKIFKTIQRMQNQAQDRPNVLVLVEKGHCAALISDSKQTNMNWKYFPCVSKFEIIHSIG
mgnify:CR=1 FL=1